MISEIIEIYVRVTGGYWGLRERTLNCKIKFLKKIYMHVYDIYLKSYGSYIGHNAIIKSIPCFPHSLHGIFIAGGAQLGRNCVIFQHVIIGSNPMPFSSTLGSPTIGDNCYIGAGATITGNVTIGDNCRIGANCTVFSDIPDNSIVVTDKPRVITKDSRLINKYYRWSPEGPIYFDYGNWILEPDEDIVKNLKNNV
jgi:serine O-acetyltransferase